MGHYTSLSGVNHEFLCGTVTMRNAARMVEEADYYQALLHGYPQQFSIDGIKTPAKEVARSLLQSGFQKGTPVRLISCWTGVDADGAAYQLSRYLKSSITAPTNKVQVLPGGSYLIDDGGRWKTFFSTIITPVR